MSQPRKIQDRIARHGRDVVLMERLFSQWRRERVEPVAQANARLDAIEAQLARLERIVTMAQPVRIRTEPSPDRSGNRNVQRPLAARL